MKALILLNNKRAICYFVVRDAYYLESAVITQYKIFQAVNFAIKNFPFVGKRLECRTRCKVCIPIQNLLNQVLFIPLWCFGLSVAKVRMVKFTPDC